MVMPVYLCTGTYELRIRWASIFSRADPDASAFRLISRRALAQCHLLYSVLVAGGCSFAARVRSNFSSFVVFWRLG
jgi:hypothetical protein